MDDPDPLDLARARAAERLGWIDAAALRSARAACAGGGSIVDRLVRDGALDPARLAGLFGSGALPREDVAPEATSDVAPLSVGSMIGGHFRVTDVHQGGFGRVYLCEALGPERYRRGDRRAALKTLRPERLRSPEDRALFQAEASAWIALGAHPNLVLAYGVVEHQRLLYIVLECVEGGRTLQEELDAGPVGWSRALLVALGVARALAHAEAVAGLVHGDLKPLNVLVTPEGAVKLTDFGMSVCVQGGASGERADMIAGTPGYFAPEMLEGLPERTTATDLYAFGVTLFYALVGRLPFRPDVLGANLTEPAPDPRRFGRTMPDALAAFVLRCLDRDPGARGTGFADVVSRLERLHRDLLGVPAPEDRPPDVPARADALVNAAQSWLHLGELRRARASAEEAIARDGANWRAHDALGLARLEAGEFEAARASFEAARRLAPDAVEPSVNLARALVGEGPRDEAIASLRRAIATCARAGRYAVLAGAAGSCVELLSEPEAYDVVHRILGEDPNAAVAWNARAVLMRRMGAPALALESADRALAVNPAYAAALVNRANALVELGRFAEAAAAADRALAADATLAGAYAAKATALAQLGRLREARAVVAQGRRVLPASELLRRAQALFDR